MIKQLIYFQHKKVDLSDPDWEKKQLGQFVNFHIKCKFPTRCVDDDGNSLKYANYLTYTKKIYYYKRTFLRFKNI